MSTLIQSSFPHLCWIAAVISLQIHQFLWPLYNLCFIQNKLYKCKPDQMVLLSTYKTCRLLFHVVRLNSNFCGPQNPVDSRLSTSYCSRSRCPQHTILSVPRNCQAYVCHGVFAPTVPSLWTAWLPACCVATSYLAVYLSAQMSPHQG